MSAGRNDSKPLLGSVGTEAKSTLDEILDFGPDSTTSPEDFNERVQQLIKSLQDINRRIDRLNEDI